MKNAAHHRTRLIVRGYELDSYGHVNNAVYLQYLEQARWEFIRDKGLYDELTRQGLMLVIAETTIRYIRESLLFDELEIGTSCTMRSPYLIFHQHIVNVKSGRTVSRATVKSIFLDANRIPHDVPAVIADLISRSA